MTEVVPVKIEPVKAEAAWLSRVRPAGIVLQWRVGSGTQAYTQRGVLIGSVPAGVEFSPERREEMLEKAVRAGILGRKGTIAMEADLAAVDVPRYVLVEVPRREGETLYVLALVSSEEVEAQNPV